MGNWFVFQEINVIRSVGILLQLVRKKVNI